MKQSTMHIISLLTLCFLLILGPIDTGKTIHYLIMQRTDVLPTRTTL